MPILTAFDPGAYQQSAFQLEITAPGINDYLIAASSDDCVVYFFGGAWGILTNAVYTRAGYFDVGNLKWGTGMRFITAIPPGSIITAAYLQFQSNISLATDTVRSRIHGELALNPLTFSTYANYAARPRTVADVDWDAIGHWVVDADYQSPDLSAIIQEIIDQPGWQNGNAIVLFWDDHDDRSDHVANTQRDGKSYDGSPTACPILHVDWQPATYHPVRGSTFVLELHEV